MEQRRTGENPAATDLSARNLAVGNSLPEAFGATEQQCGRLFKVEYVSHRFRLPPLALPALWHLITPNPPLGRSLLVKHGNSIASRIDSAPRHTVIRAPRIAPALPHPGVIHAGFGVS